MRSLGIIVLWLGFAFSGCLQAQTGPMTVTFGPTNVVIDTAPPSAVTNAAPVVNPPANATPATTPQADNPSSVPSTTPSMTQAPPPSNATRSQSAQNSNGLILIALTTLASMGGFLLYQCGLTRAKNCGHTSTLLLMGVVFGLTGYWMGGFAVQTGGIGDAHAALAAPLAPAESSALDHELGFMLFGHHWGLMGSAGFFLSTDETTLYGTSSIFLIQATLLLVAVAAALGAALERGRLLAMAIAAFLTGALIYPLVANWVWGGGWLAELGREFDLGHGFIDLAGAGVVHETAGTLALVIAIVMGPRYGRFGRKKSSRPIPGHNVPFIVLGAITLFISWMAFNAMAYAGHPPAPGSGPAGSTVGLAAVNVLLAAAGGLLSSFFTAVWQRKNPEPALLCRGLLGGVVAISAGSALIDSWVAFVVGTVAGLVVQIATTFLEGRRIDDPTCASAVHGAGGAWGVVAVGLFANGTAGRGLNGVEGPVRGLFFGGAWHQLAAQIIGAVSGFVVVFILGYACMTLIQKILGMRVDLEDELEGLDLPQTGVLGYQGEVETEDSSPDA